MRKGGGERKREREGASQYVEERERYEKSLKSDPMRNLIGISRV